MKEFRSRSSGRYIFNEDMYNLQDLALSPVEMFKDSGANFVISGCQFTITQDVNVYNISSTKGYVFIDNKIREVPAFTGTANALNSIGIYATSPAAPEITYVSGDTDYQYDDYAAEVRVNDSNTNNDACILALISPYNNLCTFPDLRSAFFSKYCLINDGSGTPNKGFNVISDTIQANRYLIGGVDIYECFLSKESDHMNDGAVLMLTNGSVNTTIGGGRIDVDGSVNCESLNVSGNGIVTGSLTAGSFIKDGGTSAQFLKADGSVDDTTYAPSDYLDFYLPLTGGRLTGNLEVRANLSVGVNVEISNIATIAGNCNIGGNCNITNNCNVTTNLTVNGTISGVNENLTGLLQCYEAQFTTNISTGGLSVSGEASITGTLTTASTASIGGNTTIDGALGVTGGATIGGAASVGGALDVDGNAIVDGTISVASAANIGGSIDIVGSATVGGSVTATRFIMDGGTASQFLKADGTVDSNSYVTPSNLSVLLADYATVASLANYLPLTGGTVGPLYVNGSLAIRESMSIGGYSGITENITFTIDSNNSTITLAFQSGLLYSVSTQSSPEKPPIDIDWDDLPSEP